MLAVHFGAGNIGRGFIGNILFHSGYDMCFVDINDEMVHLLNEKKEYRVVYADESKKVDVIKNVQAINNEKDPQKVIQAIVEADLITTAIGPNVLPYISSLLTDGLKERAKTVKKPLNIIACENMIGASSLLKKPSMKI